MVTIKYKDFTVKLVNDNHYDPDLVEKPKMYATEICSETQNKNFTSKHGILVTAGQSVYSSAILLGANGVTSIHPGAVHTHNDRLFILVSDHIYCLNLPELDMLWGKPLDDVSCFRIIPLDDDMIVHGEMKISRIDADGNIKWVFSGDDAFVSTDNVPEIVLKDNHIELIDFSGNLYCIGLDGKVLNTDK